MLNRTLILLICSMIFTACLNNKLSAREWSDEVQMTDAGDNFLDSRYLGVVTDSRDNLHVIYSYQGFREEGYSIAQAVYQRFTRHGVSIGDPILLGEMIGIEDSTSLPYNIACCPEDNISIRWGISRGSQRITQFDADGEVVLNGVILEGLWENGLNNLGPAMSLDSQGNFIFTQYMHGYWNPELEDTVDYAYLYYTRYDRRCHQIGVTDTLWEEPHGEDWRSWNEVLRHHITVGEGDTMHFAWEILEEDNSHSVHYCKVDPDGNRIIDDFVFPQMDRHRLLNCSGLGLDPEGNPIFHLTTPDSLYVVKLGHDTGEIFRTVTGRLSQNRFPGWGFIDPNGDSYVMAEYYREFDNNRHGRYLGYTMVNTDGVVLDSVECINDDVWSNPRVARFSDGGVGVVWNKYVGRISDLYIQYSIEREDVITIPFQSLPGSFQLHPPYPNPFNPSTRVEFDAPMSGAYTLNILDLNGRLLDCRQFRLASPSAVSLFWDGTDASGTQVPAGTYILNVEGRGVNLSTNAVFMK